MNRDLLNDNELMKRIAKGDVKAFETLYRSTSNKIFFYLLRFLKSRESAEDIHVEVYTQVWKSAKNFKGKSRARTWIYGIARNLALNQLRKRGNRQMLQFSETIKDNKSTSVFDAFDRHQHIQKALSTLSAKHREVMDLVFFHEMTYQEVAGILGVPENTVKTRMFYAKEAVKKTILVMES